MYLGKKLTILAIFIASALSAFAQEELSTADSLAVDTPAVVPTRNEVRKERGLSNLKNHIVPVGQWVFGGTLSYSTHSNDNYKLLVVEDINSQGYTLKVSPLLGYSLIPNSIIGVRLAYSRSFTTIDNARINLGEGDSALNFGVDYYYALKHSYDIIAIWRQYIPLGRNKRFALFTEFQLALGGMESKFAEGSPIRGTFSKGFNISAGVNPGVIAFMTNNMAIEVNVGVLGINYSSTRQTHNQVTTGNSSTSLMNFSINIFSVGLGLAFYL